MASSDRRHHHTNEGVQGFARAALAGGIPCLLATKWSIPAKEGIILMARAYAIMVANKVQILVNKYKYIYSPPWHCYIPVTIPTLTREPRRSATRRSPRHCKPLWHLCCQTRVVRTTAAAFTIGLALSVMALQAPRSASMIGCRLGVERRAMITKVH